MTSTPLSNQALAARWIGRVIDDRYRVVELLGEGGMGAVFVAEHLRLRKPVALKTIRAEFAANSQADARFTREALATAQLDHPHVASAMDFGLLPEGGAYLVTQLVRGESLTARLEKGTLTWPEACRLGSQIADALAAAHAIGIIHRDLKPDNILLESRGDGSIHARVVDFGIARMTGEAEGGTQPLTRLGAVIGTPGYMAPEQAVGQQVDHRVDLYALGVILWECVTGQKLWQGDSLTELYSRQLSRPAPSLRGEVPDGLALVVERLLARTPAERPATAREVHEELRRLALSSELAGAVAPAPPASKPPVPVATPGEVTVADVRPAATVAGPATGAAAGRRGGRGTLWLVGAGVVSVLLIAVLYGGGGDDDAAKPERVGREDEAPAAKQPRRRATLDELVAEAPERYADDVRMLLSNRHSEVRKVASEAIDEAPARDKKAIPEYVRDLAQFERTSSCTARKAILARFDADDEVRALSALKIIADKDADPCRLSDELAQLIARFEAETQP